MQSGLKQDRGIVIHSTALIEYRAGYILSVTWENVELYNTIYYIVVRLHSGKTA